MRQCPKCNAVITNDSALYCFRCSSPLLSVQKNDGNSGVSNTNGVNNGMVLGDSPYQPPVNNSPYYPPQPNMLHIERVSASQSVFCIIGAALTSLFCLFSGIVCIDSFYREIHRSVIVLMVTTIMIYIILCFISGIVSICYSIKFLKVRKSNDSEKMDKTLNRAKGWIRFALIILLITFPFELIVHLFVNFDPLY